MTVANIIRVILATRGTDRFNIGYTYGRILVRRDSHELGSSLSQQRDMARGRTTSRRVSDKITGSGWVYRYPQASCQRLAALWIRRNLYPRNKNWAGVT